MAENPAEYLQQWQVTCGEKQHVVVLLKSGKCTFLGHTEACDAECPCGKVAEVLQKVFADELPDLDIAPANPVCLRPITLSARPVVEPFASLDRRKQYGRMYSYFRALDMLGCAVMTHKEREAMTDPRDATSVEWLQCWEVECGGKARDVSLLVDGSCDFIGHPEGTPPECPCTRIAEVLRKVFADELPDLDIPPENPISFRRAVLSTRPVVVPFASLGFHDQYSRMYNYFVALGMRGSAVTSRRYAERILGHAQKPIN